MENSNESFFSKLGEKIGEQVWFQQLKSKWDELDPQSRTYLKYVGGGASFLATVGLVIFAWSNVRSLRQELAEKSDLLNMIQTANEEVRRLREANGGAAQTTSGDGAAQPWQPYIETNAANAGIDRSAVTVEPEKSGAVSDMAKEAIIQINVKKVDIRKVARFAYFLENGSRPMKLRNLTIERSAGGAAAAPGAPAETTGALLDATLAVSGFTLKQ